jgi:Stage II sporulation protein E (SpoIIE)
MSAVAGDFYAFLLVDEKHLGVLIADVTGHGIAAALIAAMLKVAFAGQASHAHDPARVLTGLNLALCGKFEEHFITAAYLFVDLENRLLRYSAAGHPPLMLATSTDGTVREIEENGLMLAYSQRRPTHRWKFESPAETAASSTLMEFSRRLILRGKNLANRAAKNSWNRIGISQPRILLMIFLPASRHFPASAPLAHRRTTSPCSSSISKQRVHESSDKNSEANYVPALQS